MVSPKISFLFGAGAEGKQNFDLPSGLDFMASSYLDDSIKNNLLPALKEIFSREYFDGKYKYTTHSYNESTTVQSILKKWIYFRCQSLDCLKSYEEDLIKILNEDKYIKLIESIDANRDGKKEYKSGNSKNGNKYNNEIANMLKNHSDGKPISIERGTILDLFMEGDTLIKDLSTGISHILDGHFHSIINPQRHGKYIFSKVFNYYWSIFFTVYKPILSYTMGLPADNHDEKYYEERINNLENEIKKLYSSKEYNRQGREHDKTYYHWIGEKFRGSVSGIMTTNYFKFAEDIIGEHYKKSNKKFPVAYLNGELKLFEIPETLEVIDIIAKPLPTDKLYFPFIFGQSYVKPIVSKYQIEAFAKMKHILDRADIVVILGYNINEDDNHINAFLRDFVTEDNGQNNKKIVVVTEDDLDTIRQRLRLVGNENVHCCKVEYTSTPEEIITQLKSLVENYQPPSSHMNSQI